MSDNNNQPFIWAQDIHANVKEPIHDLKEKGWRYGDIPAASNFNWIFKTMTEEIASLKKEVSIQKERFSHVLMEETSALKSELSAQKESFSSALTEQVSALKNELSMQKENSSRALKDETSTLKNELGAQKERFSSALTEQAATHGKLSDRVTKISTGFNALDELQRNNVQNLSYSLELTWELLRGVTDVLRQYHPNFPQVPWPAKVFYKNSSNGD